VAVIVATGSDASTVAAKAATSTIPIVFVGGTDPVRLGIISSLNRPGGNVTGVSLLIGILGAKRLELLREVVPKVSLIAVLLNPSNPNVEPDTSDMQAAARAIGQQIVVLHASSERDIDAAFASIVQQRVGAILVAPDGFFTSRRDQLVALAARHSVPAMYSFREFAAAGGLISYGSSLKDTFRQGGIYTGRILKGVKPVDLPVMLPTKFELVLNLKTAKALGLTMPDKLLAIADEVIE
jgi:putative ABC transport system substrate-binding protein